jgi:lysophospholipase L1-like esterase
MFHDIFIVLVVMAAIVPNVAGAGAAFSGELVVVAFGDSTTAPRGGLIVYAALVEKELSARGISAKVINAGVPSNTTSDARVRLEMDVVAHNPSLVIIQFGINDAAVDVWNDPPATLPRVSVQRYENNLHYLVQRLKDWGAEIVLMTPNPCRWTEKMQKVYGKPPYRPNDPDGFNVLLSGYAETVRRVARQEKVTLIDVYKAFEAYGEGSRRSVDELLLDGVHPSAKGHELIAKLLLASKPLAGDLDRKKSHYTPIRGGALFDVAAGRR